MEQKEYGGAPLKKIKELTRTVPAAVSSATSSLSSFTSEHNLKDFVKKARLKIWRDPSDDESKKKAEVDDLVVLNENKSSEPLERGSAIRATSLFKKTQPKDKVKPNSLWHVPTPLPDLLGEPIKPDSPTDSVQSGTQHDKIPLSVHRQPFLVGFEPLAAQPEPLPRKLITPPTIVIQDETSPSRPQSLTAPVPLPRTKFLSQRTRSTENAPSYRELRQAAMAVESSTLDDCKGAERPDSMTRIDSDECPICFTKSRDHAAIPCGHIYCEECAVQQLKKEGTCYICKRDIIMINKVYIN